MISALSAALKMNDIKQYIKTTISRDLRVPKKGIKTLDKTTVK